MWYTLLLADSSLRIFRVWQLSQDTNILSLPEIAQAYKLQVSVQMPLSQGDACDPYTTTGP